MLFRIGIGGTSSIEKALRKLSGMWMENTMSNRTNNEPKKRPAPGTDTPPALRFVLLAVRRTLAGAPTKAILGYTDGYRSESQ